MADAIDIIAREVAGKMGDQIERRIQEAVKAVSDRVQLEAQRRIESAVAEASTIATQAALEAIPTQFSGELVVDENPATDAKADAKADAKDRAWRTLAQGIVVTVLVAIVTAFGTAVSSPEFELLTWDSWRTAATTAGTAAMISIVAYIQRLVSPPKRQ